MSMVGPVPAEAHLGRGHDHRRNGIDIGEETTELGHEGFVRISVHPHIRRLPSGLTNGLLPMRVRANNPMNIQRTPRAP